MIGFACSKERKGTISCRGTVSAMTVNETQAIPPTIAGTRCLAARRQPHPMWALRQVCACDPKANLPRCSLILPAFSGKADVIWRPRSSGGGVKLPSNILHVVDRSPEQVSV